MLETQENPGRHFTTYVVRGSDPQEVDEVVNRYVQNYHPAGYGTEVVKRSTDSGVYEVHLRRFTSCD